MIVPRANRSTWTPQSASAARAANAPPTECTGNRPLGQDGWVLILRATQKLLHRIGPSTTQDAERSTTLLGDWYATAMFWKPQVALLVNETTLLPVLMPLAPAATLTTRVGEQIATVLTAHGASPEIVEDELHQMRPCRVAPTANRSVVGVMTEFTRLVEIYRDADRDSDLLALSLRLARTPCSPLYRRNVSPDRELRALLRTVAT
jgi:hypothetical protein